MQITIEVTEDELEKLRKVAVMRRDDEAFNVVSAVVCRIVDAVPQIAFAVVKRRHDG